MTKLDTAGLVERQQEALNQCRLAFAGMVSVQSAIDMIDGLGAEALTQAAAPDMAPVARRYQSGYDYRWEFWPEELWNDPFAEGYKERYPDAEPLYSSSQLSALQERVERTERERDAALRIKEMSSKALAFEKQLVRADAAEARVAELEALIQNHGSAKLIRLSGAALAHKGEGR